MSVADQAQQGWVGRALKRKEDPALITGRGHYVDDIVLPGTLYAAFVRSPEAHARIVSIDASAAKERDDVVMVATAEDIDGLAGPLPMAWIPPGVEVHTPEHWPLAKGSVKHVGDPVAVVFGTDRYSVVDAADEIAVEYDPLPVVVDPEEALKDETIIHESLGTNVSHRWSLGGGDLEKGFAEAEHVVERRVVNHRTAGGAIEPRGVLADYRGDELTIWTSTQVPHFVRLFLAHPAGHQPGPRPRGRARRRRRLRLQAADVRRGGPGRVGRAQARPAGQVDRDALGEHAGLPPRARPDRGRPDGPEARRHHHRVPREDPGGLRRVPHAAHADDPVARGVRDAGLLPDAGRDDRDHGRLHEQVLDGRHPRRGPPGGDPHDRDGARAGRRGAEHRPGGDPPPELHPRGRLPVRDADRCRLRLGQLPGDARQAHGAPRPARRPSRARAAAGRRRLPRHRVLDVYRDLRDRALARHRSHRVRSAGRRLGIGGGVRPHDRRGDGLHGHVAARAGARDDVRAGRRGQARHDAGQRRHPARRHLDRAGGAEHLRLALHRGGRRVDRTRLRQGAGQGEGHRRAPARGRPGRHRSCATGSTPSRARPTRA